MSSIMEQAFTNAVAAKGRIVGVKESVTINGDDHDALVDIITATEVMIVGGKGDRGGFRCQVAKSEFDISPAKYSPIIVRGSALQVLSTDDVNGIVYIFTAGDPLPE